MREVARWRVVNEIGKRIVLSLASERIAELGCAPVGEDAKAFVDRGGFMTSPFFVAVALQAVAAPRTRTPQAKKVKKTFRRAGKSPGPLKAA